MHLNALTDEEFRAKVLEAFEDEDLVKIFFLSEKKVHPPEYVRTVFARAAINKICGYLFVSLLGSPGQRKKESLVQQFPTIKENMHVLKFSMQLRRYVVNLQRSFRHDMYITHPEYGKVSVTYHAWERFFETAPRTVLKKFVLDTVIEPDIMYQELRAIFLRSTPINLPYALELKKFLKNNQRESARRFDPDTGLRFVVVRDAGKSVLVTVETNNEKG